VSPKDFPDLPDVFFRDVKIQVNNAGGLINADLVPENVMVSGNRNTSS